MRMWRLVVDTVLQSLLNHLCYSMNFNVLKNLYQAIPGGRVVFSATTAQPLVQNMPTAMLCKMTQANVAFSYLIFIVAQLSAQFPPVACYVLYHSQLLVSFLIAVLQELELSQINSTNIILVSLPASGYFHQSVSGGIR